MQGKTTLTQKNEPLLCQIQTKIDLKHEIMVLSASWKTNTCEISLRENLNHPGSSLSLCSGKVCGDIIEGYDCGEAVADWLEDTLGLTGLRLVKLHERKSKSLIKSLANEAQFLCLNYESAKTLHSKIQNNIEQDVDWLLEQFRGNLIFNGFPAYVEEFWQSIQIGNEIKLQSKGPCTRCNIIRDLS